MKAAFLCEFATIRNILIQWAILYLILGVVVGIAMESSVAMVACIAAMTPFLTVFTLSGYDAVNGWESFRACLPISRGAVAFGRYVVVLLVTIMMAALAIVVALVLAQVAPALPLPEGTAANLAAGSDPATLIAAAMAGASIILFVTALILPFILRFGMNKAMRIIPIVMVLAVVVAIPVLGDVLAQLSVIDWVADLIAFAEDESNLIALTGAIAGAVLIVYAASGLLAARLYRGKEL